MWFVRNLPILDLANPSLKVNQIMPANLYDDVIFTPTPKVDRCTTCHVGIDKKGYESAPQPFTTHPDMDTYLRGAHPMEKIGCTACHQGRGRATGFQAAAHIPSSKEQEKAWGKYTGSDTYHPLHYWDLPMTARGHTESQCQKCHQGVVEVPKAERLNTRRLPGREVRLPRLPQDQGLGGPAQGRPRPHQDREQDQRGVDLPLDQGAEGLPAHAHAAGLGRAHRRDARPEGPQRRRGQRGGGLHRGEVRPATSILRRPRATWRRGARPSRPWAAWPATGSATTAAGSTHAAGRDRAQGARRRRLPHPRPEPGRHRQQGGPRVALLLGARPQGLLARDADAEPAAHGHGGRGHHGLPDEPQARRLHGAARGRRSTPKLRDTIVREYLVAQLPTKQADEKLAAMDDHARTLFLGETDDRPLRLLRLPRHRGLREDLAHRRGADRGGIQAGRAARLRLRAREHPPHPARLGPPQGQGAAHLRPRASRRSRKSCCACPSSG